MITNPTPAMMKKLWDYCVNQVDRLDISCAETVYQTDRVVEASTEIVEGMCEIVGYKEEE